jgi:hypothetical protein
MNAVMNRPFTIPLSLSFSQLNFHLYFSFNYVKIPQLWGAQDKNALCKEPDYCFRSMVPRPGIERRAIYSTAVCGWNWIGSVPLCDVTTHIYLTVLCSRWMAPSKVLLYKQPTVRCVKQHSRVKHFPTSLPNN